MYFCSSSPGATPSATPSPSRGRHRVIQLSPPRRTAILPPRGAPVRAPRHPLLRQGASHGRIEPTESICHACCHQLRALGTRLLLHELRPHSSATPPGREPWADQAGGVHPPRPPPPTYPPRRRPLLVRRRKPQHGHSPPGSRAIHLKCEPFPPSLEVVNEGPFEVLLVVDGVWFEAFKPSEWRRFQGHREVECLGGVGSP
jgi:hypothetical protein